MAGALGVDVEKRIKALRKKLTQIEKLKGKGGTFTQEEQEKISSEQKLLAEIDALQKGEEFIAPIEEKAEKSASSAAEAAGPVPSEPEAAPPDAGEAAENAEEEKRELAPAEAEKRVKALKKKLAQIEKLKLMTGDLSAEVVEKLASEPSMLAEVMDLEISLLDPDAKKTARTLQKKLDQIAKLRKRGGHLTIPEKEKLGKEAGIQEELKNILDARTKVPLDKAEKVAPPPPKKVEKAAPAQKAAPASPPRKVEPGAHEAHIDGLESLEPWVDWDVAEEVPEDEGFMEARTKKGKKGKKDKGVEEDPAPPEEPHAQPAQQAAHVKAAAPAPEKYEVEEEEEARDFTDPLAVVAGMGEDASHEEAPPYEPAEPESVEVEAPEPEPPTKGKKGKKKAKGEAELPAPLPAEPAEVSPEKRIRNLKKKLVQIEKLKAKQGSLIPEEVEKLESEATVLAEIQALERGETWVNPKLVEEEPKLVEEEPAPLPAPEEPAVVSVAQAAAEPEPPEILDPADAEKKVKALKKKLGQIQRLKEKSSKDMTPEEKLKLESEATTVAMIKDFEKMLNSN